MIYFILHIFHSKLDLNGNTYWAVRVTGTKDGRVFEFQLGDGARSTAEKFVTGLVPWNGYYTCYTEMPKRDFKAKTKGWQYDHDKSVDVLRAYAKEVQS